MRSVPAGFVFQTGCPDGEFVEEISRRADNVLSKVRSFDGPVALFSHGHFLRALAARWIGCSIVLGSNLGLDTGSLGLLDYERSNREVPIILRWKVLPDPR